MNFADEIIILIALLVGGTWFRWRPDRGTYANWRAKASFGALLCGSSAAGIALLLRALRHFSPNATDLYFRALEAMTLLALLGILRGLVGKGSPRLAGLFWSAVMLAVACFTFGTSGH
jgi:hypothetical protein